jgi:protein TonB
MMVELNQENRDRLKSGLAVTAFHALLGYALITGLGIDVQREVGEQLKMFDVREEPPPPPAEPPPAQEELSEKRQTKDPEGAASPPNLRDTPSPVVAPPPKVKLPVPPPVVAAPVPGQGNAEAAGAADVPGPGTGSGGVGNGLGSGGFGNGTGGGGGGRPTHARLIRGSIRDSDYPRSAYQAGVSGTVFLRFVVAPDGRVSDCAVTRSSGHRDLDSTTCRVIMRRFVYRPARDAGGNPVAEVVRGEHVWELEPERAPIDIEPTIPDDE